MSTSGEIGTGRNRIGDVSLDPDGSTLGSGEHVTYTPAHGAESAARAGSAPDASSRATAAAGGSGGEGLATFLGWFSVGLGTVQVIAPRTVTEMIGLRPTRRRSTVMQLMGIRELTHGLGILSNPRSARWVGSRVGGDVLDLALLGVAVAKSERPQRTLLAAGAVLGTGVLDVLGTRRASRAPAETPIH